jgi:hypothetical protein
MCIVYNERIQQIYHKQFYDGQRDFIPTFKAI